MRIFVALLVAFLVSGNLQAQHILSGTITTNRLSPLDGAHIHIDKQVASTNPDGKYVISDLPSGKHRIVVSFVGYQSKDTVITILGETKIDFRLKPDVSNLSEVVVKTESASEKDKKSSAVGVENISNQYLKKNLGGSLMQSLENIGGVTSIGIGSGQSKPVIRGLGFNRVVVTESGIKHEGQQWGADHGLEIDQYGVGSVRLVKGPQSLVYGSDAIGGVIEIEKPKPPLEHSFAGSVEFTGKTNNNLFGSSVNLFGRQKKFFFDARFTSIDYADYKVPTDYITIYSYRAQLHDQRLRNTAGNERNLHLSTGYIGDKISSIFYISNLHTKSGMFANAHGLEPRNVDTDLHDASNRDIQNPYQDVNHLKVINRTKFHSGRHDFQMDLGFQFNHREEFSDYISHGSMPPVYPDYMQIPETLEREFSKNVYALNFRDNFSIGRHEITAGINLEHQNSRSGGWGFVIPTYRQSTGGLFAYDKISLSDELLLHLGARYDYGHIETDEYFDWFQTSVDGTPQFLQRGFPISRDFHSPSWSVGINYNPGKWNFRANVGQSFRMPIAKELASNGVNYHQFSYELGNSGLDAEKSYQLDFGAAFTYEGFSADVSPFLNYFPNYIYLNPTPRYDYAYGAGNQIFEYTQSRVLRYGSELKLNYKFLTHYAFGIVGEYVYSEQMSGAKKGFTLPFSPPASALFNFTYTTDIGKVKDVYGSADFKLVAAQNNIVPPENKTPGYGIVNLGFGGEIPFAGRYISVNLQAQNLFNKAYFNHTSFYRIIGVPDPGLNVVGLIKIPFGKS